MARDQEPMTDAEIEALREEMRAQREQIRADLEEAGVDVSSWDSESDSAADSDHETADAA